MSVVPKHIGPYRVIRPIAQGGMAEVFEVVDPSTGDRLALKLLVNLQVALKRFNREYEAMARLNHPGVVRVYHYGLHNGQPWLTMELLQGLNVQHWCKKFGPPGAPARNAEVLRVGYHLANALHYVHDRGLVHRDLKSANAMVLPDARVKLVDFGTAHLKDGAERITRENEFVGTFAYASPEQVQGHPVDFRSDLYSLGVLLYRLGTGRRPFGAREPGDLAYQHIHEPPPSPQKYVRNLPDELSELILELLAKNRDDRPANAGVVATLLEQLHGTPFSAQFPIVLHRKESTDRASELAEFWDWTYSNRRNRVSVIRSGPGGDHRRFCAQIGKSSSRNGWSPVEVNITEGRGLSGLIKAIVSAAEPVVGLVQVEEAVDRIHSHIRSGIRELPESREVLQTACAEILDLRTRALGHPVMLIISDADRLGPVALDLLLAIRDTLEEKDAAVAMVLGASNASINLDERLQERLGTEWHLLLKSLSPAEVAASLGTMLGRRPPPGDLALAIHGATGGGPHYVESALNRLLATGDLVPDGRSVDWASCQGAGTPPDDVLRDAERALSNLPVSQRRLLELICVCEQVSPQQLAEVVGWDVEGIQVVLDDLVARGLVVVTDRDVPIRVVFPGVSTVIHSQMHSLRRLAWGRQVANRQADAEPSRMLVHARLQSGDPLGAAVAASDVGQELLDQRLVRTAREVLEPVVRGLAGSRVPNRPAFARLFMLHSLTLQSLMPANSDTARSLGVSRMLLSMESPLLPEVTWAQAEMARSIGHYQNYSSLIEDALDALKPQSSIRLRGNLLIERGYARLLMGSPSKAEASFSEAEVMLRSAAHQSYMARARTGVAACVGEAGRLAESAQVASESMALLERSSDRQGFWKALAVWGHATRRMGQFSKVLPVLYQHAPEAREHEDVQGYNEVLLCIAWCEVDLERLGRAQECVDELASTLGRDGLLHLRLEASLVHGRILLSSGEPRLAAYKLQDAHHKARTAGLTIVAERARYMHAEALWILGDRDTARSEYQSSVLGLMGVGATSALCDAVISRAHCLSREVPPEELFQPVNKLLKDQPPPVLVLEELLCRGRWRRLKGDREARNRLHRAAAMVLNQMATQLNDTDRAAILVHSWSRRIRRGLR